MLKVFIFNYYNQQIEILLNIEKIKCAQNRENGFILEYDNHQIFHHEHSVNLYELAEMLNSDKRRINLNEFRMNL